MAKAKMILRYLAGTQQDGLTFDHKFGLNLEGYCDASYAEDPVTRKSTTGYLYTLAGGPISWKSGRQDIVTTSSTEAEYVAYTSGAKEAAWIRGLLEELGYQMVKPTLLSVDSQSAMAIANGTGYKARTKHIDVRYHYIREAMDQGVIRLEWVPTEQMAADGLTKALNSTLFDRFKQMVKIDHVDL